jgi:hypothetical protein
MYFSTVIDSSSNFQGIPAQSTHYAGVHGPELPLAAQNKYSLSCQQMLKPLLTQKAFVPQLKTYKASNFVEVFFFFF